MKILFVSCNFPRELKKSVFGLDKRMAMFVEALKGLGELDMLFYVPSDFSVAAGQLKALESEMAAHWGAKLRLTLCPMPRAPKEKSLWRAYGQGAVRFYEQSMNEGVSGPEQVRVFRNCLERRPDVIFAHRLRSMVPLLLAQQRSAPVFLDLDDIEHVALIRSIAQPPFWFSKPLRYLQVPALMWGERQAIRRATKTFVCSDKDARYLSRFWRLPGIATIPNAVRIPERTPLPDAQTVLFLGRYSYPPNANAAEHMIHDIWPGVRRACPAARLVLAGEGAELLRAYENPPQGVEFRGFVDDLDELYRTTRVVCSPIQSGGGTRFKIVEAAAYGRPIVATRLGAEGLAMKDGESILLHDDPEAFAQACVSLLRDDQLATQIGERGREHAISTFDRDVVVEQIRREITACLEVSRFAQKPSKKSRSAIGKISIVVCTFNRCSSLAETLASLQRMRVPDHLRWNILVVDNNSTDDTRAMVERLASRAAIEITYLFEPKQGLSHARNRGILATDSEYVAFTDDDVLVDENWLKSIAETFTTHDVDCVGGKIVPHWLSQRPGWLSDRMLNVLAVLDYGDEPFEVGQQQDDRVLFGANFAFKRESLIKTGMFNIDLGRKGQFGSGEDKEVLQKLRANNGTIIYDPRAVVLHKVPAERLNKSYFRRWHYEAGKDRAKMTTESRFTVLGIESYLFRDFLRATLSLLRSIVGLERERAFEYELKCITYLSVFKHKLVGRSSD